VDKRRYTKNGEWVAPEGDHWRVGLAASVAADLGDVTFVELPLVGRVVAAGEAAGAIEAVKAAMDYYCPLEGTVVAVNDRLTASPQLINTSPEGDGWLFALGDVDPRSWEGLMDAASWQAWEAGR